MMNVGILGCGLIGHKRAHSIKNARVVACADIDSERAKLFAEKFTGVTAYNSAEELFENSSCEIIIIATPHNSLPELIKKGLEHKRHILVEKPAARFASELMDLQPLANKYNLKVRVGFNHRYHRAFQKAKEIVDSGALGDLMFIRARYGHGGRIGYNKEWRAIPALSGGGELIDQGSHLIDLSRMFLGNFTYCHGIASNFYWDMPVDDNAFMTLKTNNDQIAFLQVSCTEWKNTFSFELYGKDGKLDISGLGGSYGVEKLSYFKMLPQMGPPETTIWEYPMADDSWEVEFTEFLEDIELNRNPSPGLIDAIENLKIINKVYLDSGYDYNT